jgi:phage terminase large subunit GpA-like protein
VDVWAWGRGLESWLVDHIIVPGDPGRAEVWSEMTQLLERTWEHSTGARMSLQRLAIDTGFTTQQVYAWARTQDRGSVLPVRGIAKYDRIVPVSGPTKIEVNVNGKKTKRGLNLWTVSVSVFKKELYKLLGLDKPTDEQMAMGYTYPLGFVHLPDTTSDEWIKQLVAEQQVIVRSRHGFSAKTEWRQLRPRNEALDCRVYARAAVWLSGADRWSDARWAALEAQLGLGPLPARNPPPPASKPSSEALAPPAPAPAPAALPPAVTAGNIRARPSAAATAGRRRRVAYWGS